MSAAAAAATLPATARNRRILLLTTSLDFGGAETVVVHLAKHLARKGWEVRVVSVLPVRAFREELEDAGISVGSLNMQPSRGALRGVWRLVREARDFGPAIIHAHMFHANLAARLVKPVVGCKVICTLHSTAETGTRGQSAAPRELAYRLTNWLADANTAVSDAVRERYDRERILRGSALEVVANGVDIHRFRANPDERRRIRTALGWRGRFVWLAVGRLAQAKNYPLLLSAFRQVRGLLPGATLAIAGDGPMRDALHSLVTASGLERDVVLLGTRTDIASLLNGCDAFVLASDFEGSSLALLEAGAVGKPAVSTEVGAASQILRHGETGFLCPPGNLDSLVQCMRAVMELSVEQRETMGHRSQQHIRQHFSLDRVLPLYERIYERTVQRRA